MAAVHVAGGPAALDAAARSLGRALDAVHALSTPQQGILFAAAEGTGACGGSGGAAAGGTAAGGAAAASRGGAAAAGWSAGVARAPAEGGAAAASGRASTSKHCASAPAERAAAGCGVSAGGAVKGGHVGGGASCSAGMDGVPLWRLAAAAAAIPALQVAAPADQQWCNNLQPQPRSY